MSWMHGRIVSFICWIRGPASARVKGAAVGEGTCRGGDVVVHGLIACLDLGG